MRNTFSVLFYVNRAKEKNGKVPVMGRITVNGTMAYFSCKCAVEEALWSVSDNRAHGKSHQAAQVNTCIDNYRAMAVHSYNKLLITGDHLLTARMVKEDFLGQGNDYTTLLQHMRKDIELFAPRINKDRSNRTFQKMKIVHDHTLNYIRKRYRTKDFYLQELDLEFIKGFSHYLQFEQGLCQSTVWVYTSYLKKIVINAHLSGELKGNPFHKFRISPNVKQREFLSERELKALIDYKFTQQRLSSTIEIFLFSCFTGISFADIKNLRLCNIHVINGKTWILSSRQKTGTPFQIQLLSIPAQILKKAVGRKRDPNRRVFDLNSYECTNRNLKVIAQECGINKNLTFHIARHTFATMALSNGMPIESVSKSLGHSNITTTQIYAKIVNSKLSQDFSTLENKLEQILTAQKISNKIV